ncbi:COMM domain-containing protein 9-like [Phoenix dactylifera]|uniref:COMM domain-containing protein 9-like n=1 Tax=Phoenix dactylifera TaxID=42345 RepID=A0A8B9AD15_PHODC|nr:COMM domain-containing protein 9-like [Phoenix dactylifera]
MQLLVCLRMLIRRCVYENITKDEIQKLFPQEVLPELQRLLTLLLQKFQREWRGDVLKDQVSLPRLKAMTWNMANQNQDSTEHAAIINLKLQGDTQSLSGETEVKFQLAKETLETMLKSMYFIRDQLSNVGDASNGHGQAQETVNT